MAHTPIFDSVAKAFRSAESAERSGNEPTTEGAFGDECGVSRRTFLTSVAAAAIANQAADFSHAAEPVISQPKITIVGAGMGGLHCAYRLNQVGIRADIYEASERVGGRMESAYGKFPSGQIAEMGGEFFDTGHHNIRNLARELRVKLDDLAAIDNGVGGNTFFFDGRNVPLSEIVDSFRPLVGEIVKTMAASSANREEFLRLDNVSILDWLDTIPDVAPVLKELIDVAYTAEFGIEAAEQSVHNLLYLIPNKADMNFRIFNESDMRFRAHDGNSALTKGMAEALPHDALHANSRLVKIREVNRAYELTFQGGDGDRSFSTKTDFLVLAIPFSILRDVDIQVPMDEKKRWIIDNLAYGTNAKIMGAFSDRVWRTTHNANGTIFSDEGLQWGWETSRGQAGKEGLRTRYFGGKSGTTSGEGTAEARFQESLPHLDKVWPGTQEAYTPGFALRKSWGDDQFAKGSYSTYRLGQWEHAGEEGRQIGNIFFCGEHCSPEHQGWMEGAAQSGARVAKGILDSIQMKKRAARVPVFTAEK